MVAFTTFAQSPHGRVLNTCLWATQIVLFASFVSGGVMKLSMPVARLSKMFAWTGQVSKPFLRFIGLVDLTGGLGILLPTLTQILPKLVRPAALGCTVLQVLAIGFHVRRKEISETPFNWFLLVLCVFVLWGR